MLEMGGHEAAGVFAGFVDGGEDADEGEVTELQSRWQLPLACRPPALVESSTVAGKDIVRLLQYGLLGWPGL